MTSKSRYQSFLLLQGIALALMGWADLEGGKLTVLLRDGGAQDPGGQVLFAAAVMVTPALILSILLFRFPAQPGSSGSSLAQAGVIVAVLGFVFRWGTLTAAFSLLGDHALGGLMALNEGIPTLARLLVIFCAVLSLRRGRPNRGE